MIYLELFYNFLLIGLFSIGGGHAAIPFIQERIVEKSHWITMEENTNLVTIAEVTPGPIAVNSSTFVGWKVGGTLGVLSATLGCILPSIIILSIVAVLYKKVKKATVFQGILLFIRPVVVALIAAAGLTILRQVLFQSGIIDFQSFQFHSCFIFLAAFYLLLSKKWNPVLVIFLSGLCHVFLSFVL